MKADAISAIQKIAVEADSKRIVRTECEPPHVYYVKDGCDGSLRRVEAASKPAAHQATVVRSLCAWSVDNLINEIWIGKNSITAVKGRDRATYQFEYADQLKLLQQWSELPQATVKLSQAQLYKFLRTTVRNCVQNSPNLVTLIGRVDIKKAQEGSGSVSAGKVSVSKAIMAQASGAGELPETLVFAIPAFKTAPLDLRVSVEAAFELDAQEEVFTISVLPGELDKALHRCRNYLLDLVQTELEAISKDAPQPVDVSIYFGDPSQP